MKINFNKQDKCPVCNSDIQILDTKDVDESGYLETWTCPKCKCNGKQYFEFADHYDVYTEDGETRIDKEDRDSFPYLSRERLLLLLNNALSVIHDVTGEDHNYEGLNDLQSEIGVTRDEYEIITGNKKLLNITDIGLKELLKEIKWLQDPNDVNEDDIDDIINDLKEDFERIYLENGGDLNHFDEDYDYFAEDSLSIMLKEICKNEDK